MPSQRQERVNSLIRQYLGKIINRDIELPAGVIITIAKVEVSSDLKNVRIGVSILPEKYRGSVLELLRKRTKLIQRLLNKKLTMKFSPKIDFLINTTAEQAADIERLLDEIKKEL